MKKIFKKTYIYADIAIILCLIVGLVWAICSPLSYELSARIYYREFQTGITSKIYWTRDDNFTEADSAGEILDDRETLLVLGICPEDLKGVRFDASDLQEKHSIAQLTFLVDGVSCGDMRAQQLYEAFVPVNAEIDVSEETDALMIYPENGDSGLLLTDENVLEAIRQSADELRGPKMRSRIAVVSLLAATALLCVHLYDRMRTFFISLFGKDEHGKRDIFVYGSFMILLTGAAGVFLIGLFSALGLHPDEWDVKACLDYGMTHFLPPDMRDPAVAGTYSGYGYTKLDNATWYFFLAGKIALISKELFYGLAYYRIPNLLLFAMMILLVLKSVRKQNWLMLCAGISAQVWYIFSYTTADAMDYFAAFLVILQISGEESMLFRTLSMKKGAKLWMNTVLLGTLFYFVFLGKPYYWSVLGLAFLVLLKRLVESWKDEQIRRQLFSRYLGILLVFFLGIGFRYSFDFIHYGLDKASVEMEMDILYAHYDKNPTTPEEEWCPTYHMMERGYTLMDLWEQTPDWFSQTYKSFCGLIDDTGTTEWYYLVMGILYAFIYLCILHGTFFGKTGIWDKIFFAVGSMLMAAALAASIMNSWMIDSQPQGRYLLPVLLIAGFMASRVHGLAEARYFKVALLAAGILTAGYYILAGVPLFFTRADLPF